MTVNGTAIARGKPKSKTRRNTRKRLRLRREADRVAREQGVRP